MQRRVRDLIKQKNLRTIPQIQIGSSVEAALERLDFFDSGALLVVQANRVMGVFSERDFARAPLHKGTKFGLNSKVEELMTAKVIGVSDNHRLDECMAIMSKFSIRHLPVLHKETPIAMISMRHIMEAIVEDKEFMITELTKYVTGSNFVERESGHAIE